MSPQQWEGMNSCNRPRNGPQKHYVSEKPDTKDYLSYGAVFTKFQNKVIHGAKNCKSGVWGGRLTGRRHKGAFLGDANVPYPAGALD